MAAEVSADLNVINDEDLLRRMWQQTDDFGYKKEIRQRMYKLREQRLKDFYTGDQESIVSMASRKHAAPTHADSISDQGFMALKSKEIRDSESPTRDIHRRQGDNNYWNTVQQSSYSTHGDDGNLRQSYDRSSTGTGHSEDGKTQIQLEADERGFKSSKTTESDNSKTISDQQQHDAHIATASHTKTDDGEAYSYSTSKEHQESKSSVVKSKDSSSTFTSSSTKWETSSNSSRKEVSSSSRFGTITADADLKALTSGDGVDLMSRNVHKDHDFNKTNSHKTKDVSQDNRTFQTTDIRYCTDEDVSSKLFIDNELRNNIKNSLKDVAVDIKEDHFGNRDSKKDIAKTYKSEVTSNVSAVNKSFVNDTVKIAREMITEMDKSNVVDQNIMSEINKLDSFLSTQNTTGTTTPNSPRSVMGDVTWTAVPNNEVEFEFKSENAPLRPGSRATAIKQPDNLDLPKDCTVGQYVTTYNEHYTSKKISMDVSPTHDAFARSLRQTPPGTPRSLSRQSLDRSSPERKTKNSPRSSPDKERKSSVGSYTVDKSSVHRKTSDVARQTNTSKDSPLKSKRKFSTTQTKAAAKARASTPGTSPTTSPSRKSKERSESPSSSASDSDASQRTYDKKSTTSTHKRADVVRKNLMDSFDKDNTTSDSETIPIKSSSRPSSPEKSCIRKLSNATEKKTTGILRKDSRTDSTLISESSLSTNDNKMPTVTAPHLRDKSPEYSSEGSVSREIKHSQRALSSPDCSPERAAFTPIKQFRTNPEMTSDTIQVTATDSDQAKSNIMTEAFIKQETANENITIDLINVNSSHFSSKKSPSPKKEDTKPTTLTLRMNSKDRSVSPDKARPFSPSKNDRNDSFITRKESTSKFSSTQLKNNSQKETNGRSKSPAKSPTSKKQYILKGSQSPEKETVNRDSPSENLHLPRKKSVSTGNQPINKREKSRSPSPIKKGITSTAGGQIKVKSTLTIKDVSIDSPPNTRQSNRTPSPPKSSHVKSRSPSPKKETFNANSQSPQREKYNKYKLDMSSPSVSPCSSPERLSDKSKPIRKTSGPKASDKETIRASRRSSIPRADQSSLVKKTVQTTIEIRSKPINKTTVTITKVKPTQSSIFKTVRTNSQNSMDRQTTSRSYSTSTKKINEETKEPLKITTPSKRTVTTTAVIALQKPTVASKVRQTPTSTVSRATTYNRVSSKEIIPKRIGTPTDANISKTMTTKRSAIRTNTPKATLSINMNKDETDKCEHSKSARSETAITHKIQSKQVLDNCKADETTVHGFKDETLNIEIEDNILENETRPELFPDTEDEEIVETQENERPDENVRHVQEKTILIDSQRKGTSQFMVTIKKPTHSSIVPSKTSVKTVTTRSSSGPIRGTSQTPLKATQTNIATNAAGSMNKRQFTSSVQKADSLNSIKSVDRNRPSSTPQRRQMSKPEMSVTKSSNKPLKSNIKNQTAETGIATRNVTNAKSVTVKRFPSGKNNSSVSISSSSSEDEDESIPSVVTPNRQEQEYIEELEQMRRAEEQDYASKLVSTSNHENQLLNVIVQHPKSSRESSPDYSNRSQTFCTVSDDGGSVPRYADMISEPEDVDVFDPKAKPKSVNNLNKQPIQVTDLDEESEAEGKLNVSVADRVSHFLETSKAHSETLIREESENNHQVPNDGAKSVLKAKAMFETIVKNQLAPPAPGNKHVDILSRPSIFEARRGQTTPKNICSETASPQQDASNLDQVAERIEIDSKQESNAIHEIKNDETIVDINSTISHHDSKIVETQSTENEPKISSKSAQKPSKTDLTSKPINKEPASSVDKKLLSSNRQKPLEKTISSVAEISSKKAFFERKSHDQNSTTKQSRPISSSKERKPLTDSIQNKENISGSSPTRRASQTTTFIEKEKINGRTSPVRKVSIEAPAKERKHSVKSDSPERKISLSKSFKDRRSSFTKDDVASTQVVTFQKKESFPKVTQDRKTSPTRGSPERRAPITLGTFPDHKSNSEPVKDHPLKSVPSSPVKERKPSFTRESPERVTPRKTSRTSTDRTVKSPERSSPSREPVELNKAGKFGVTLRRTSSTTSAGTPRRSSIPGETQEIEDVTDLSLLEIMMEKAVGYEQRRRIRAQIREVKKFQDQRSSKNVRKKSPVGISLKDQKVAHEPANRSPTEPKKSETKRPNSPTKSYQEKVTLDQRSTWRTSKQLEPTSQPVEPTRPASPAKTSRPASPAKTSRPASPVKTSRPSLEGKQPLTNGFHRPSSPDRMSPAALRTSSPSERKGAATNGYPERAESVRRSSKPDTVETTTTVRTQKRVETLVESGVDCITSSYGVGPTDERGRPLFGLRALRRSNTNKQLTDEVVEVKQVEEPQVSEPTTVCDTRGRPLFGGLKALRVSEPADDMPEQNSTQLRELVQRHEKVVRETNGPQDQPRQKPKAKLRDSFILQEDEQSALGHLAEVNNLNRGLSLKSIIQKHENIATDGSVARSEMESSHTVVTSRTAVSSDGSISHSRDIIKGEVSAKNGEEPVGKVTRTQYTYQSPQGEDKGVSQVTTSTTNLGRRLSGPSITEIEDVQDSPPRKSSLKSSLKRSSVTEVSEDGSKTTSSRKGSLQKSGSEEEEQRRFSSQERETEKSTSRLSSTSQKFTSFNDSGTKSKFTSTRQTELRSKAASPSLRHQKSSEEESSAEEKPRKAVTRGDSVRALQHKFQQATENAANSVPRGPPARAGLILRTSSFSTADSQNKVSSTLKQSTSISAEKKNGRQSPDKSRRESSASDTNTARRESSTSDSTSARRESLSKASSDSASRRESLSKTSSETSSRRESVAKSSSDTTTTTRVTETSSTSSFLDNRTRVTGVQDILDRMRNADLVNEVGDTDADREARALLNKFLGASVILQGMEQGMRGKNGTGTPLNGTPGSAALVSSVEKQRLATTRQKEEDIENIWDEQVLKTLLEQCTDYEGRRKLRARLRTVMAEHKACADLVAITGDTGTDSSQHAETETKQTTMRTEGGTVTRTEVHTRTSTNRLTKANSVSSPFAKFRQLERQNSAPSVGQAQATPLFKITDPRVARSASSIKDRLLSWVQAQTRDYKNIQIDNFSTSWNNGLAFCALIHHFCPDAFDYDKLTPDQRRHNFDLAFRVAEEKAGIAPLLDTEDMVVMRRPDWKCVFTYVQSIYRRFHSTPEAVRC